MFVCLFDLTAQLVSSAVVSGLFSSHKSFLHPNGDWNFLYMYLDPSTHPWQSRVSPLEDPGDLEKGLKVIRVDSRRF